MIYDVEASLLKFRGKDGTGDGVGGAEMFHAFEGDKFVHERDTRVVDVVEVGFTVKETELGSPGDFDE